MQRDIVITKLKQSHPADADLALVLSLLESSDCAIRSDEGQYQARDAFRIWALRKTTSAAAGQPLIGIDTLLSRLEHLLPADQIVHSTSFNTHANVITVFVDQSQEIVGFFLKEKHKQAKEP